MWMADMSKMSDKDFWAEVRNLLATTTIGMLADYVTGDAERRDPELARLRREKLAIIRAASERAGDEDPLALDAPALTSAEEAAFDVLNAAYRERFTALAADSGYLPGWADYIVDFGNTGYASYMEQSGVALGGLRIMDLGDGRIALDERAVEDLARRPAVADGCIDTEDRVSSIEGNDGLYAQVWIEGGHFDVVPVADVLQEEEQERAARA